MYLFSFLWNEILVLIFYISFICKGWPLNSLKCTARGRIYVFLYIDQHPGNNCVLFIELFTNRHVSAIRKNNYSIFIPIVAIWLWDLRNNYLFYNLPQFLKFVLYCSTKNLDRSWTIRQTGKKKFCWRLHKYMSYYNCCGIRPKHSNISKGGGCYNLCGIEI
jgi:hypothetical protein